MNEFEQTTYRQVSQWKEVTVKGELKLRLTRPRSMSHDSRLNPGEDFANNFEYFLFESQKLKFKSPRLYDWFSIEYGDKIKK